MTPPIPSSATLPPALRLRIKALLDSGVTPDEIVARLADPDVGSAGHRTVLSTELTEAIGAVAAEAPPPAAAPASPPHPTDVGGATVSLVNDAKRLLSVLASSLQTRERGTVIQFISARRGEGASTIARDFARVAAQNSDRPVLLLDLDWAAPSQYEHFQRAAASVGGLGSEPGPAVDLGIDPSVLLRFTDKTLPHPLVRTTVTVHRIGATALYVTRLGETGAVTPPASTRLSYPAFWDQLRAEVGLTVIDAPPVFSSFDGLAVSPTADKVVVVVEAETTRIPVAQELIGRLTAQGADIAGIILNKRRVYIPKFIYRWL
ncbi:P-loop NTPase family protein [Magnetospirillum molischianum]|uniref:Uncharacterized protein n=1 Tax=Magnetospirillum molischianum DSM 120 TaxID=1150626 RepID=H8FWD0_MAGML|nr:hypothetical protein [Magnetospirillum molischianum]CCG42668.1 hypothetical protein PHAMO_400049 [Magnetospirillum molischianum DSM 120]